ncbi:MAG: hypothetical protein A2511_11030 [Deltaproteobacteria bacterium RIFOXYD12_FULL_50_9]|nr:MAG: hypothetical protein A2511_11030 [Deltaproteobacteria bacterium RIFOXYD12_FULL_50_9]
MIAHKKEFGMGAAMFAGFWVVFIIIMSPVFEGKNILDYMDNLYNTISKKSAYFVPVVQKKAEAFNGQQISFSVKANGEQAERLIKIFEAAKATATVEGEKVKITGDMGAILANMLADADAMYKNEGKAVAEKYGYQEKQALYDIYTAAKAAVKDLNSQSKFKEAALFNNAMTKALEPAYNYYGIPAVPIAEKWGTVVISLVGYVIYTLWFGFSILFMFEGWGLKLEH